MKVLWFTKTSCGAAEKLNNKNLSGGWLVSLEKELKQHQNIELSVCFYSVVKTHPFKYKGVTYYPMYRKNSYSKIGRYINRLLNREYDDKVDVVKLLSVVETVKPDIIHIHGTEENFGLLALHTKIPIAITIQGILSSISEKYFSGIPFSIAYKRESFKDKIFRVSAKFLFNDINKRATREREILSHARFVLGRTDWDKRITRILAPKSTYYNEERVLREAFYKDSWEKEAFGKKIRIITNTSSALYKGFETIVKTASILSGFNNFDFEWLVVGVSKNDGILSIVKDWLKTDYNNHFVYLLGHKTDKEIVDLYLSADIYCQVSHIENSSNSLSEAMLVGIPIVASFAGGTDSLLENRREGILVQSGDPYSYAGAIMEIASNFNLSQQYANCARKRALERHDKKNITDNLVQVYNSIVK